MGRKVGVSLKIDVSKIDKSKLFKGQKGTYLDAQVFIDLDEQGQYGDNGMVTQSVSKEDREQGVVGVILGNCKVFWQGHIGSNGGKQNNPQQLPNTQNENQEFDNDFEDDIPF